MYWRLDMRDAFPKSADEQAQSVVRLLRRRRADMDASWKELEEGWTAHNKRMAELGLSFRTSDEGAVKLNAGGSNICVCWHLLAEMEGFKDSVLGSLLEGVWGEGRIPRDADGRIVLDVSSAFIKHIIHTMLRGSSSGRSSAEAARVAACSAVDTDEVPCFIYTAHVVELPGYVPTHPKYVNMNGGSTTLQPFEIAPFRAIIRQWVKGSMEEMTLIYRATQDGFNNTSFKSRCDTRSPTTISLIRVSSGQENVDDSVVGSYSVVPLGDKMGSEEWVIGDMFLFMLKDGSATRKGLGTPIKWHPSPGCVADNFLKTRSNGACFGGNDLVIMFDQASGGCYCQTKRGTFDIDEDSPFLALNENAVVDIEVYRYSTLAPPATTAPIPTTNDDTLTDKEIQDVRLFGESIASSLMEERVVLDRALKEMEAAGARVSAAVGALETVYGPSVAAGEQDAVVELNVRGTRMTTLRSTLQACSRSALAAMFEEDRWPATDKDKDEHGSRLIDCNPTCFSKIIEVLRMRKFASWSREAAVGKQREVEESSAILPGGVLIKEADAEAFGAAVNMYFPGCESFITDLVQPV